MSKLTLLDTLFFILLHFLGIKPAEKSNYYKSKKPLSPEMKKAVRKMERYSNENRLIATEKLKTADDVVDYISFTKYEIENLTSARQKIRNKLRNCIDENFIEKYKTEISGYTKELQKCRKNLKIANQILEDIPEIRETIKAERQMRNRELNQDKIKNKKRNLDKGAR